MKKPLCILIFISMIGSYLNAQVTSKVDLDAFIQLYAELKDMKKVDMPFKNPKSNKMGTKSVYLISKKDPSIEWMRSTSIIQGQLHTFDMFSITRKDIIYSLSCNTMMENFEFKVTKKKKSGRSWDHYIAMKRPQSSLPRKIRRFIKYPIGKIKTKR